MTRKTNEAPVRPSTYLSVDTAAKLLTTSPRALRARCRRALKIKDGIPTANLGGGVTAFKLGATWRLRFPAS